jgi:hypothetical protein
MKNKEVQSLNEAITGVIQPDQLDEAAPKKANFKKIEQQSKQLLKTIEDKNKKIIQQANQLVKLIESEMAVVIANDKDNKYIADDVRSEMAQLKRTIKEATSVRDLKRVLGEVATFVKKGEKTYDDSVGSMDWTR